jgi:hypothetical protein
MLQATNGGSFNISISGGRMTAINGNIPLNNGNTEPAPGPVTPDTGSVTPPGGGGGDQPGGGGSGSGVGGAPPERFYIQNDTPDSIMLVYARRPGTTEWVEIGEWGARSPGSRHSVRRIPSEVMDNQFRADIQARNGRTLNEIYYTRLSQPITHDGTVTFTVNDLDDNSPRMIFFRNETLDSIMIVTASRTGSADWAEIKEWGNLRPGNTNFGGLLVPRNQMDSQHRTYLRGIWGRTLNDVHYTRALHPVVHHETVTFTINDLDDNSPRIIFLENNTTETIMTVHAQRPGTPDWTEIKEWGTLRPGNTTVNLYYYLIVPRNRMDNQHRSTIQGRTGRGATDITFTRTQEITHRGTITFTNSDIDGF